MKAKEFWQIFVADMEPGAFMLMFPSKDPKACVHQYLQRRPVFFGIVRLESWKHTFQEPVQYTRETVENALISYLEETRPEWEEAVAQHARELERQAAIEATQRMLAERNRQEEAARAAEAAEKAGAAQPSGEAVEPAITEDEAPAPLSEMKTESPAEEAPVSEETIEAPAESSRFQPQEPA